MKLLKSMALISGAMAIVVVVGLLGFLVFWAAVVALTTVGFGLGIPYVYLLVTAGF